VRTIEWASSFKRDHKRETKGKHCASLDVVLMRVIQALRDDQPLQAQQRDHDLVGNWQGYRECHLKPDLLLIYRKIDRPDGQILRLARLGSHSEIFG